MADENLAITNDTLVRAVALELGWGWTAWSGLDADSQSRVKHWISTGKRMFYSAPMLPKEKRPHIWSFLKPLTTLGLFHANTAGGAGVDCTGTTLTDAAGGFTSHMVGGTVTFTASGNTYEVTAYGSATTLTLAADCSADDEGAYTIHGYHVFALPAGFGALADPQLSYLEDTAVCAPLHVVGEGQLRVYRSRSPSSTGRPHYCAVRSQTNDGSEAPRYELVVFPDPDTNDYTVEYRYDLVPEYLVQDLSVTGEVPLGANLYGQTLLNACLAAAEKGETGERGARWVDWAESLARSIYQDRQRLAPPTLGYHDGGGAPLGRHPRHRVTSIVYENG